MFTLRNEINTLQACVCDSFNSEFKWHSALRPSSHREASAEIPTSHKVQGWKNSSRYLYATMRFRKLLNDGAVPGLSPNCVRGKPPSRRRIVVNMLYFSSSASSTS